MTDHSIDHGYVSLQGQPGTPGGAFTDTARVTGDTQRITIGGYQPSGAFDNVKTSTRELMPRGDGSQGILSTARSTSGRPLSGNDVKPDTTVMVHGMETSVAAAVAAGFLQRNGDGSYSDVAQSTSDPQGQPGPQQDQPQAQPAKVADLPGEAHQFAMDFTSRVGNVEIARGLSEMIEGGALSQDSLSRIAGATSLEPGEVVRRAETIRAGYEAQAREMLGPWADHIISYANLRDRSAARKAVDRHINHEAPDAYDGLVQNFWLNLDKHNPDLILKAGNASEIGARRESNGTITVQVPGMPTRMTWGAAVRAGFIGKGQR
jgi:hypothetical protein